MGLFFNSNSVFSKLTNLVLHMFQFYDLFVSLFVKFILSNLDLCFGEFVMSTNSLHNPQQEDDNKQKQANHPLFVVCCCRLSLSHRHRFFALVEKGSRKTLPYQTREICLSCIIQSNRHLDSILCRFSCERFVSLFRKQRQSPHALSNCQILPSVFLFGC